MTYSKVNDCPWCGAPVYVPSIWHGTFPPTPHYTCNCRIGDRPRGTTDNSVFWPARVVNPPTNIKKGEEALEELFRQLPKRGEEALSELLKQFPTKSPPDLSANERLASLESKVEEILQILVASKNSNKRKRKSKKVVLKD
jgi:hypothetical protein